MSLLERRVQLLLGRARYEQVQREAERTSQSVAAVIRRAIDRCLGAQLSVRAAAADRLLADSSDEAEAADEWSDIKTAIEADSDIRFP